jgi:hypothetical protein
MATFLDLPIFKKAMDLARDVETTRNAIIESGNRRMNIMDSPSIIASRDRHLTLREKLNKQVREATVATHELTSSQEFKEALRPCPEGISPAQFRLQDITFLIPELMGFYIMKVEGCTCGCSS